MEDILKLLRKLSAEEKAVFLLFVKMVDLIVYITTLTSFNAIFSFYVEVNFFEYVSIAPQ